MTLESYSRVSAGGAPGLFACPFLPLRSQALLAPFAWPRTPVQLCLRRQYRGSTETVQRAHHTAVLAYYPLAGCLLALSWLADLRRRCTSPLQYSSPIRIAPASPLHLLITRPLSPPHSPYTSSPHGRATARPHERLHSLVRARVRVRVQLRASCVIQMRLVLISVREITV